VQSVVQYLGSSTNEVRGDICAFNVLALIDDVRAATEPFRLSRPACQRSEYGNHTLQADMREPFRLSRSTHIVDQRQLI